MADLTAMLQAAAGQVGGINPREYFNTVVYTGTLSTPNAISGVGFAPDFIWFKSRTQAYNNYLFNKITSGSNFYLATLQTPREQVVTPLPLIPMDFQLPQGRH
jgi:hypothetical protein